MAQLRTILVTFFAPRKAFTGLIEKPRAMAAILLLIVVGIVVNAAVAAKIDLGAQVRLTTQEMAGGEKGKKISETEIQKEAVRALNVKRIVGYAKAVVFPPLMALALAILFWLPCRFSRHRVGFRTGYAIAAHLWLPFAVRGLLSLPVIMSYPGLHPVQTSNLFKTSLASVVTVPGAFLADPFWIWMGALFAAAFRAAGWKTWASVVAGVILWLLLGFAGHALT